jgi:tripartite-type tricarboxylate transporter receptor subunit TctC
MKALFSFPLLAFLALAPMSAAGGQLATADGYPAKPVKIIVPYPAGAAADVIGRIVADRLSQFTKARIYVENIPGASNALGAAAAARAPADGYTLLLINQDFVIQPLVKAKISYDPVEGFVPIAGIATSPETISVHPSVPATTMQELIALVKANPGKYTYASPGVGTSPHIAMERLFKVTYGLDVVHVPFQGGGPAVVSTLGGHTQILHITLPLVAEYIKQGKLRGLAVAAKTRSPLLPDLPTLAESGIPNHEVGYWTGILAPAGTSNDIVQYLNQRVATILSRPDLKEDLAKIGFATMVGTPARFSDHMRAQTAEWDRVIRAASIRIE